MNRSLSSNTQAILLLTAPLIAGRGESSSDLLTAGEYKRLARFLRDKQRQYLRLSLPDLPQEVFYCAFLDAQNRVIAFEELFRGTLTQTSEYRSEREGALISDANLA